MLQTQQKFSWKILFLKAFWESIFLFLIFFKNIFIVDTIISKRSFVTGCILFTTNIKFNKVQFKNVSIWYTDYIKVCFLKKRKFALEDSSFHTYHVSVLDNQDHRSCIQNRKLCIINCTLSLPCITVAMKPLW